MTTRCDLWGHVTACLTAALNVATMAEKKAAQWRLRPPAWCSAVVNPHTLITQLFMHMVKQDAVRYKVAPVGLLRHVATFLAARPGRGGCRSNPSYLCYANASHCFCLSSIVTRRPWKCIGIVIFMAKKYRRYLIDNSFISIGDNSIDI